jgi:hypothetical protein
MNNLDKFRYSFDDPSQLNISLKKDPYEKATNQKSDNINQLLSTSVRVTKEIFPNINSAIENVFKRLKIENNLNFFITANHFQTQASCSAMPLGDSAEIILTSKLIELLNGEELESVIAHEVAHFYYQHALYPQPNSSMNRVETLNLLNFSRAAEISADRIGFIGCGSLESSLRAMLKITSGLSDKHLKFNFSNYLDQLRELKEIKGDKNLMYSTHPNFLNRMQALIWFSMSNEYNQDLNSNKKGSFDLKTVDQKIDESIKKVIGDEVDYSNKDVVSRALMWGSIEIFLSDKKFSKKEQELFKKNFGEKRAQSMLSFMKMANPKSIQAKIDDTFKEASTLLKKDKENIVNELSKLIKVADGDLDILKNTIKKLKTSIKF